MVRLSLKLLRQLPATRGLIGETGSPDLVASAAEDAVGELLDVLAVADDKKPLAALDFRKVCKGGSVTAKRLKNSIIRVANKSGVHFLELRGKTPVYLKTVFYKPSHRHEAVALMLLLHGDAPPELEGSSDIGIGLLLGYDDARIRAFFKQNNYVMPRGGLRAYKSGLRKWLKVLNSEAHPFKEWSTLTCLAVPTP